MSRPCAMCGSENTTERVEREEWELAGVEGLPLLIASIPVTKCLDCDFEFTDDRAETIRDAMHAAFTE